MEGSAFESRVGLPLDDVSLLASSEGLDLHVVSTEVRDDAGGEVIAVEGEFVVHSSSPDLGAVARVTQCRPAGIRTSADVYVW